MPNNITIALSENSNITIETGKLALLASGAVTVRQGDTIILAAACSSAPRQNIDFFPLQVDYREKFSAAGMIPGGYFKREGRPSEKEILSSRMIDRPIRPLFPKGYVCDVQIQCILLSADGEYDADVLGIIAASAALTISDIPFMGPIGALRVGHVDGKFIANPSHAELEKSDLDLVYAGIADKVIMIEGSSYEVSEELLRDATVFANEIVKKQIDGQKQLAAELGKSEKCYDANPIPLDIAEAVRNNCISKLRDYFSIPDKTQRVEAIKKFRDELLVSLLEQFAGDPNDTSSKINKAFEEESRSIVRRMLLEDGLRSDGRKIDELRPLNCEVSVLPRTHGSAIFARGETQALVTITLGPSSETQGQDAITGGESEKRFYLHYNFPNFSTGETGRIMGPGRREIGHGALAERSVAPMMPDNYPYVVRCVADIMSSNGSTSMASVCGATLALMDAGVPLKKPVAGISCGLVCEDDQAILLTDILGSEDHYGDMDFKVAGTVDGITGFQLDLKIPGIPLNLLYDAMLRNKSARLFILQEMNKCITEPRTDISPFAPRIHVLKINPDKIGALIGPGGKVIRGITETHEVSIDIEDDGTVAIFSNNGERLQQALEAINLIIQDVEIGKIYRGIVKSIKEFGAFVEVIPGTEGLLHISEMADYRVKTVEDICSLGDKITVKVIDIDDRGRVRLSRKAAMSEIDSTQD